MQASSLGYLGAALFVLSVVLFIANRLIKNDENFLIRKAAELIMAIAFGLISYALIISTIEQYEMGRAVAMSRGGSVTVFNKHETPLIFILIVLLKIVCDTFFIALSAGWIAKFLGLKVRIKF